MTIQRMQMFAIEDTRLSQFLGGPFHSRGEAESELGAAFRHVSPAMRDAMPFRVVPVTVTIETVDKVMPAPTQQNLFPH